MAVLSAVGSDEALRRRDGSQRSVVRRRRGQCHGLPRAERSRQDDDDADAARAGRAHAWPRARLFGRPYAELERPGTRVGAASSRPDLHPGRRAATTCGFWLLTADVPTSRVEEVLALVDLQAAAGRRAKGHSLGMRRAPEPRGRAARRSRAPDPRRARQRARPRGSALAARLPARIRGGAQDGLRLEPPAGRSRTDGRPRRDHQPRPARRCVAARRAHRSSCRNDPRGDRSPDALELALRTAGVAAERENGTLHVHGTTADRIGEIALAAHVELRQLVTESSTLEDVFLEPTAEPPS